MSKVFSVGNADEEDEDGSGEALEEEDEEVVDTSTKKPQPPPTSQPAKGALQAVQTSSIKPVQPAGKGFTLPSQPQKLYKDLEEDDDGSGEAPEDDESPRAASDVIDIDDDKPKSVGVGGGAGGGGSQSTTSPSTASTETGRSAGSGRSPTTVGGLTKTRVRRISKDLPKLPPPTSLKDQQLREINESLRLNISRKITRAYGNLVKDINMGSDLLADTLNLAQKSMNTQKSFQDQLKKLSDNLQLLNF